ncbi:DsbA family protein [Gloeothece verrucosa]|uniref:DSBA oxidoreductase n=1 Tax=Gloeothece verrucosa (strain PCC 7822) TaxID=497965 RepID=E0U9E7_GLOV7|nr:thioredoxin domain-containing protein [Gloeothece verrucosa]ADN12639.1 DSBA oxidoreductase [Gloeothece verrucosa PCC 7822]
MLKIKKIFYLAKVLLLCLVFCSTLLPVYAATTTSLNSPLEEQVLQIIRNHPDVILESVKEYQNQQYALQEQKKQAALQEMKNNPEKVLGNSPTLTASAQKLVMVEFSDFQCPFCSKMYVNLKKFLGKHSQEVSLTYKHYPLSQIHKEAMPAALAAWAASQQGQFWPFHDRLFSQQDKLGEKLYLDIANELALNLEQFNRDRNSEAARSAIEQDMAVAENLGIEGTPYLVIYNPNKPDGKIETFSGALDISQLEKILANIGN